MSKLGRCPKSWEFYFPVLSIFADGQERDARKIHADVAKYLNLGLDAKSERTGKRNALKYVNRANWAAAHMRKLGWIESKWRGVMRITVKGKKVLAENPDGFSHAKVSQIMAKARMTGSQEINNRGNQSPPARAIVRSRAMNGECPESWKFYYPVLHVLSDGNERASGELYDDVAAYMKLSDKALREMTGGKNALKYTNRSNMAAFHMRKLGWIVSKWRGATLITPEGRKVLAENPNGFTHDEVKGIISKATKSANK